MFVEKSAPEVANSVEAAQDGRIHIEKINALFRERATPAEYSAGLKLAFATGLRSGGAITHPGGLPSWQWLDRERMRRGGWAPELFKPSGDSSASRTVC
jgi:hypothetical protein